MSPTTLPETEIEIPFTWNGTYQNRWVDIESFKLMAMVVSVVISGFISIVAGVVVQFLLMGLPQSMLMSFVFVAGGLLLICAPSSLIAKRQINKVVEKRYLEKRLYEQKWAGAIIGGLVGSQLFDNTHVTAQAATDLIGNRFALLKTRFGDTYELHLQRNLVTLFLSTKDIKENTINREAKEWAAAHPNADIAEAYAAGRRSL